MTDLRKLSRKLYLTVVIFVGVALTLGEGVREVRANSVQSRIELPSDLTASDWGKIERQISGLLEETKLTASDAQYQDYFGGEVSIGGDIIVVGSGWEDGGVGDPLTNAGAVYVFKRDQNDPSIWGEVIKLAADDAQENDFFGRSVSIDGDTIVVGASSEDGGLGNPLPNAGAVYIFERNQGGAENWGQVAKLSAADAQAYDYFGRSVSISGDTIVAGGYNEDGGPGDPIFGAGAAYVFDRNEGGAENWGQVAKITADDAEEVDRFGFSVSISGDTIVAGAANEDGGPGNPLTNAGAAYVFDRNQGGIGAWGQVTKLVANDAEMFDWFGNNVAVSGDLVVAGAHGKNGVTLENSSGNFTGAAYVFDRNQGGTGAWGQTAKLTASDAQMNDYFGVSVAVNNGIVVVGAFGEEGGPGDPLPNAGAAYVFGQNQGGIGAWGEIFKISASDAQSQDGFGQAVTVDGDTFVVTASGEDGGSGDPVEDAGAAYVFLGEFNEPTDVTLTSFEGGNSIEFVFLWAFSFLVVFVLFLSWRKYRPL